MSDLDAQVGEIVQLTTSALLACEATPCGKPDDSVEEIIGEVWICGGWIGRLQVACQRALATALAAAMFGRERAQVTAADAADALGELANILGGNFKSLVAATDGACTLSLPHLVERAADTPWLVDRCFDVVGHALRVRVVRGTAQ